MESPASAGLSRVVLALALLLGGCAVGDGGDGGNEEQVGALPDEFAEPASPLTAQVDAGGTASVPTARAPGTTTTTTIARDGVTTSTARGGGAASGAPTTTLRPFHQVAAVADRTGDAGLQARPYGDVVLLRLEDDGTRARVVVRVAGDLPAQPAEGEVVGIGVDLFRSNDSNSDYQLFAIGNADGWRAGLQESTEWVDYPGTFELGGNTLVFTVPWSSLGGRRAGRLSVFADWSQARAAVLADASEDHAPDRGTQSFSP